MEDRVQRSVKFLGAVSQAKSMGMNCPDALLEAYREELGEQYPAVQALAEQMPALLNEPDLCDIFAVTFAIIATLTGVEDGYAEAVSRMRKEYGTNGCGSARKETTLCVARMKDCVLMIEWAIVNAMRLLSEPAGKAGLR